MKKIPKVRPISRTFFCEECLKNHTPKENGLFITIGATGRIKVQKYTGGGVEGFTPHFVQLDHLASFNVQITVACAVDGCGIDIYHDDDFEEFEFDIIRSRTYKIRKEDWTALQDFKDKYYYI